MICKNLIALFSVAALFALTLPARSENANPDDKACPAATDATIFTIGAPAPVTLATPTCGSCSSASCVGKGEGLTCYTFAGELGICLSGAKNCSSGNPRCICTPD
jgi:hypothetical protein